jgi:hypothetical protein
MNSNFLLVGYYISNYIKNIYFFEKTQNNDLFITETEKDYSGNRLKSH